MKPGNLIAAMQRRCQFLRFLYREMRISHKQTKSTHLGYEVRFYYYSGKDVELQ